MLTLAKIKKLFNKSKLSTTITINKYTRTTNQYGDSELTLDSSIDVKGIIGSGLTLAGTFVGELKAREGEMMVYFAGDVEITDDEDYHYTLTIKGNEYDIIKINKIGIFEDTDVLVYECLVKPKII